jgi:hypothetical protein
MITFLIFLAGVAVGIILLAIVTRVAVAYIVGAKLW